MRAFLCSSISSKIIATLRLSGQVRHHICAICVYHALLHLMHALQGNHMQTSLSISVLLMVAVGGSLGAVLRYLVTLWSIQKFGDGFPWGTLLVNIVGAFFVGLMIALLQERTLLNPYWRPLVVVGALGSLTTFSMFSVEMLQFIERGNWALALAYMLSSVIICIALVAFGLQLGKLI